MQATRVGGDFDLNQNFCSLIPKLVTMALNQHELKDKIHDLNETR